MIVQIITTRTGGWKGVFTPKDMWISWLILTAYVKEMFVTGSLISLPQAPVNISRSIWTKAWYMYKIIVVMYLIAPCMHALHWIKNILQLCGKNWPVSVTLVTKLSADHFKDAISCPIKTYWYPCRFYCSICVVYCYYTIIASYHDITQWWLLLGT